MFCILFSVLLIQFFLAAKSLHLSPQQLYSIRGLLLKSPLNEDQRASLQNLLYVTHQSWAVKQAVNFKELHHYKCRDITTEELVLSSKFGLLKSSRRYDGRTAFSHFSEIYVRSELLKTLTTRLSVTTCVSSKDRMKSAKTRTKSIPKPPYSYQGPITSLEPRPYCKQKCTNFYDFAWQYVDTIDAFTKHVVTLKYDYEFNVKNTNRYIANLMCCSEETVRKAFNQFSDEMQREVLCFYTSV